MSDEPQDQPQPDPEGPPAGDAPGAGEGAPPSEEELRARIEEGLRTVRIQDVVLESAVTLVNVTARRIAKEDERDLEQARVGIEAVRGLVDLLEGEAGTQVRNALSELQMIYARAAGGSGPQEGSEAARESAGEAGSEPAPEPERPQETPAQGQKKPPPGLWVPPGSA